MEKRHCEHTVLVVDDDRGIREALCEVLADNNYKTEMAANGRDALLQLEKSAEKPSVILLDIMMPVMDGWTFLAERQANPAYRGIPVVILSAHANQANLAAWSSKVTYLRKPVDLAPLLDVVHDLCAADATSDAR